MEQRVDLEMTVGSASLSASASLKRNAFWQPEMTVLMNDILRIMFVEEEKNNSCFWFVCLFIMLLVFVKVLKYF